MSFASALQFPTLTLPRVQLRDVTSQTTTSPFTKQSNRENATPHTFNYAPNTTLISSVSARPSASEAKATYQPHHYLLEEKAAARRLGISPSLLRCYTQIYQRVGGRLSQQGRYDHDTLERFQQVLEKVQQGATVDAAMRSSLQPEKAQKSPKLRELKAANKQLSAEVDALRCELEQLKDKRKRRHFWN